MVRHFDFQDAIERVCFGQSFSDLEDAFSFARECDVGFTIDRSDGNLAIEALQHFMDFVQRHRDSNHAPLAAGFGLLLTAMKANLHGIFEGKCPGNVCG